MYAKYMRGRVDEMMDDQQLLEISRREPGAFTRCRAGGMGFKDALCFMLDMRKTTLQSRLNLFYREVKGRKSITEQAFSKLRAGFDHTPFEVMTRQLVREEYSGQFELPTWHGYHVFADDGSYLQLPTTPELAAEYGVRGGGKRPSAGISVLYDVLHGWPVDPIITRTDMNERDECAKHIDFLKRELPAIAERALLLLDRGYPSYELLQKLKENGMKFVIRCSTQSFQEVVAAPLGDSIVTLKNGQKVRVVKFLLSSGEVETLATSLFHLPEKVFPDLYAMRWGIETMYHRLKCIVGVEQFSGKTPNAIRQDFWASMLLLVNAAIFQNEADEALAARQIDKSQKHVYRTRTSDLVVTLRDRLIFAVLCGHPTIAKLELDDIFRELSKSVSPVRPGRSYPRTPKPYARANPQLKSHL